VAIALGAVILLIAIALVKAGLVLYYYMHIYKLSEEQGGRRRTFIRIQDGYQSFWSMAVPALGFFRLRRSAGRTLQFGLALHALS